ncbi:MAG: hypothetical protein GEU93_13490 [Propionibacteriales bacterium]|nr:hypothetical protein [Propionibacteriales bacterium]
MADLERELRDLGAVLAVPDPPDVRASVRARLERPAPRRRGPVPLPVRAAARWAVAAMLAISLAVTLAVSPDARAAVAELFRFAGIEVHWGTPDRVETPSAPLPGERAVTLDEARRLAEFRVGLPASLGEPDTVLVADSARVVSLLYGAGADEIRLDEFDGGLEPGFMKQTIGRGERITVGGAPALWLEGPHSVTYVDRDGNVRSETARLSGNTLIWERDGVTHRLEGDLTRVEAQRIAESVS